MARKSSFANMVLVLTSICIVCSAILGIIYSITAEPIKKADVAKINKAISSVVPQFDNIPSEEVFKVEYDGKESEVYPAKKDGETIGYAIKVKSSGFGGPIVMMVGFTADGTIYNTSVVSLSETPGLGAKLTDENIPTRVQLKGLNPSSSNITVKKDGGDIDAITASTISSRAFLKGVEIAYQIFLKVQSQN